ncbi:MAG: DUF3592 domain-containing protein [Acidimicrobiales bacterium]
MTTIYVLIAVVVVVSLLPLLRLVARGQADRALMTKGQRAEATVLSVQQTGTFVNNNPQVSLVVDVRPEDGQVFQARAVHVVPLVALPRIQPGSVVPVRYDPSNPGKVALELS